MATNDKAWVNTPTFNDDNPPTISRVEYLLARDWRAGEVPFPIEFAEVSTASGSEVLLVTRSIYVPDWAEGLWLEVEIDARVSAGSGVWRLKNVGTGVSGAETAAITGTTYAPSTAEIQIVAADLEQNRSFEFRGRTPIAGTLFLQSVDRITAWFLEK